jgi:hypothetical protein
MQRVLGVSAATIHISVVPGLAKHTVMPSLQSTSTAASAHVRIAVSGICIQLRNMYRIVVLLRAEEAY